MADDTDKADSALIERALEALEAGELTRAEANCQRAAAWPALRPDALHLLGLIAHTRGQAGQAVQYFAEAVELDPQNQARRLNLGLLCFDVGDYHRCAAHLEAVVARAGEVPEALNCLGNALCRLGQHGSAIDRHERALSAAPRDPKFWSDLAATYMAWGRPGAAVAGYDAVTRIQPHSGHAHFNLGTARLQSGDPEGAVGAFQAAVRCNRDHVQAFINLGIALKRCGRFEEAAAAQRSALKQAPDDAEAAWNLALTELLLGEYEAGFAHFEGRLRLQNHPLAGGRRWDGSPLPDGTLVVLGEQGLGDTLQFLRFVDRAAERCGAVTLQCRPDLLPLLRSAYHGPARLEALGQGVDTGDGRETSRVPLMSLPHVLCVGGDLGVEGPYLSMPEDAVEAQRASLPPGRLRVGISWQGNPAYRADAERSMPLSLLAPLLAQPEVAFISLQRGHGSEQLAALGPNRVLDRGDIDAEGAAFQHTAALLCALDLLVTTDTAIAHLAGALGVPVWLMLAKVPDFRWGLRGNRWYPSMRLFRQSDAGDWAAVVSQVADALRQRCAQEAA